MIPGSSIRGALLAVIAFALAATLVKAGPELARTKPSLRAQSWNLEITARRQVMRAQASGMFKNRAQSKDCYAALQNVLSDPLPTTRLRVPWFSPSLLLRSTRFIPSRAPPLV